MQKYMRIITRIMIIIAIGLSLCFNNVNLKLAIYSLVIIPSVYYSIVKERGMSLKYFIIDVSLLLVFSSPLILENLYEYGIIGFHIPIQYSLGAVGIFAFGFLGFLFIKKFASYYF